MQLAKLVLCLTAFSLVAAEEPSLPNEPLPAGTKFSTIKVGDVERRYILRAPTDHKDGEVFPLVLCFHGGGSNPAGMERYTKFTELATKERFIVVYPEGIDKGWNDRRGTDKVKAQQEGVDDLGFIAALLDTLIKEQHADPKRVYACGISNGAIFSHTLAAEMSERITAIGGVCGSLPETLAKDFAPKKPVSILIINGDADPIVPYDGGAVMRNRGRILGTDEIIKKWLKADGCSDKGEKSPVLDKDEKGGTKIVTTKWSGGHDGTEIELMKVEGGGHTWPGTRQYLPQALIGKTSQEFDATEALWQFFKSHARP